MGVKINAAVSWCLQIANDDSHGYTQDMDKRWGPDYDCSSFLIQAWENAGIPVKTNGASYTGNMVDVFLSCGFEDVTSKITLSNGDGLIKGDIVWKSGHTEMVSKSGYLVGAHINENGETTGGKTGDQTGKEIYERTYYNSPWTKVLRYPEESNDTISKSQVISKNDWLTTNEMKINARYIYQELTKNGWSLNAIAGMLGNMQTESNINPGIWQNLNEGATSLGFGLVQWTPATKLIEWANSRGQNYKDIDVQISRILYEMDNGIQYYATDEYPETFKEFSKSTQSPEYLAYAFLNNYERPGDRDQPHRKTQARYWYDFLLDYDAGGEPGGDSGGDSTHFMKRKSKFNFLLIAEKRRTS